MSTLTRRFFVSGIAAAMTAVAGCSGTSDDEAEDTESSPDETPASDANETATSTNQTDTEQAGEAAEHLEAAFAAADEASSLLLEELGKLDQTPDHVDFETDQISNLLDQGEEELAAAEPTGDQEAVAASLRSVFAWLRPLTNGVAVYDEGVDRMERGDTYADNERFMDAADQLDAAADRFDEAEEYAAEAQAVFGDVTVAPLEDVDEEDLAEGETAMQDFAAGASAMAVYMRGAAEFMVGSATFIDGARAFSEERYDEVIDPMESARSSLDSANTMAQEAEEMAPDWLLDRVLNLECRSDAFQDAATHYIAATEAVQAGDDETVEEEIEGANQAVNRCE